VLCWLQWYHISGYVIISISLS